MSETYQRTLSEQDAELKNRFYSNVASVLRQRRKNWAWLAEQTGLIPTSILSSKWGESRLRMPTVLRIAKVLEKTPEELLYGNSGINVTNFDTKALKGLIEQENIDPEDTASVVAGFLRHLSLTQARNVMEHVLSYFDTDIATCMDSAREGGGK